MMKNFEMVIQSFSVLGEMPKDFDNSNFKFFLIPNWETPCFSPIILLPGKHIGPSDLKSIETYFQKYPIKNSALKNSPYFNFFMGKGLYNVESLTKTCVETGWVIDQDPLTVNLLEKPIEINLPPGFHIVVSNIFDSPISDDYKDIIRLNFNADEQYLEYVEGVYRHSEAHSYTVIIRSKDDQPVGGGTVSIRNKLAFFTWGAVNEKYRGNGFHEILLAACRMIASSYGVKHCALTTRNNYIRRKSDSFAEMYICRKSN